MIYKDEQQYVPNYLAPELVNSQYAQGMQNKKLERQAVKGLTPKYCYATMSADQTIAAGNNAYISFNTFSTNDGRMDDTANQIIIPQAGLWMVTITASHDTGLTGDGFLDLERNGSTNIGTTAFPFYVRDRNTMAGGINSTYFLTVPLILNQNDYLKVKFTNQFLTSLALTKEYTQLRLISYILF